MQPHVGQLGLYAVATAALALSMRALDFIISTFQILPSYQGLILPQTDSLAKAGRYSPSKTYHQPTNLKEKEK